jgi:nicotinamide mononucleotide transporter
MFLSDWLSNNYIEVFGAITGVIYVVLEIRQKIWLWPVGVITSAVYIWVFFTGKLYADMSLQGYYLVISILGWYWWLRGTWHRAQSTGHRTQGTGSKVQDYNSPLEGGEGGVSCDNPVSKNLPVTRVNLRTAIILSLLFGILFLAMWYILSRMTDSPVPCWDSFITSLSIIATWMLARKIIEHWYLWILVNTVSAILFFTRGLYPTVILYIIYCAMSFVGFIEWKKSLPLSRPSPRVSIIK